MVQEELRERPGRHIMSPSQGQSAAQLINLVKSVHFIVKSSVNKEVFKLFYQD